MNPWKLYAAIFALVLAALWAGNPAAAQDKIPSGREVVAPTAYVSLEPVPRGNSFQLAVVLKIRPGFHINAREKSEDYLIATDLKALVPEGFKAGEVSYPKGQLRPFTFSKKPLNVYEDTVILRLPLTALSTAPLGALQIPLKLRYQACSKEICLPPVTLDVNANFTIAAAASDARPVHPDLFPQN